MYDVQNIFSIIVIIGIFLTFVPQQIRIICRKSSSGLSPYFMLLSVTSVIAQLFNILLLQLPLLRSCPSIILDCFPTFLGIIQVCVLTLSICINFILFILYQEVPYSVHFINCIKLFVIYIFITFYVFGVTYILSIDSMTKFVGYMF